MDWLAVEKNARRHNLLRRSHGRLRLIVPFISVTGTAVGACLVLDTLAGEEALVEVVLDGTHLCHEVGEVCKR